MGIFNKKKKASNTEFKKMPSKQTLLYLGLASAGLDIVVSTLGWSLTIPMVGSNIVVEEALEYYISNTLAKRYFGEELSNSQKIAGVIPIPGVTGLSMKCFQEYMKIQKIENETYAEEEVDEQEAVYEI